MQRTIFIIPPEIRSLINPHSGFLRPSSPYAEKTTYGLFLCQANQRYLAKELLAMLGNRRFVGSILAERPQGTGVSQGSNQGNAGGRLEHEDLPYAQLNGQDQFARANLLVLAFRRQAAFLREQIYPLMRAFHGPTNGPHREDYAVANPVIQLHLLNSRFLMETARNLVFSPEQVVPGWLDVNPETGAAENTQEYDYTAASWQDGTWHPEHLFSQSQRNRDNPYWVPLSVDFDGRSGVHSRGPGHRFNSLVYGATPRSEAVGAPATFSQFPRWQYSVDDRPYSDDPSGLREGGAGDRRVQGTRGFDMSALVSKSAY